MAEPFQSRTALAALGLAARAAADAEIEDAGVVLAERPVRAMVALRGDPGDKTFVSAVEHALDVAPPTAPNTVAGPAVLGDGPRILWLGPDEWLVVTAASEGPDMPAALRGALGDIHSAVVDVSDGRTVIVLSGPHARDVLAKGCGIDLHASAFAAGRLAADGAVAAHERLRRVTLDRKPDRAAMAGPLEEHRSLRQPASTLRPYSLAASSSHVQR